MKIKLLVGLLNKMFLKNTNYCLHFFQRCITITFKKSISLTKTYTWIWIWAAFIIVFFITDESKLKYIAMVSLLIFMVKYEWDRGYFIKRWRERRDKQLRHIYDKNG